MHPLRILDKNKVLGKSGGRDTLRSRLPVLRKRRRYMAIEVDSEEALRSVDLSAEIHSAHASLYGDVGAAGNRLKLIGFDGKFGIIRCSHLKIEESRAALSTVYSVGGVRTAVRVIGALEPSGGPQKSIYRD